MLNITNNTFNNYNLSFSAIQRPKGIKKSEVEKLLSEHKSTKEIAKIHNTFTQTIYTMYKIFDITAPQKQMREKLETQVLKLISEKPCVSYICEKTGASVDLVRRVLKEKNINLKEYRKQVLYQMLKNNCTDEQIAEKLDLNPNYIKTIRYNKKISTKHIKKQRKKEYAIKAYKQGTPTKEIAEQLNVYVTTVRRYIKEYKDSLKLEKS